MSKRVPDGVLRFILWRKLAALRFFATEVDEAFLSGLSVTGGAALAGAAAVAAETVELVAPLPLPDLAPLRPVADLSFLFFLNTKGSPAVFSDKWSASFISTASVSAFA